ncbi:MAG TPA: PQQ-dependent sugar dehydrogenase, partial [Thermoanaerobaculia bacterium]
MCRFERLLGFLLVAGVGCAEIPPVPTSPASAEAPGAASAMPRYHIQFEDLPQPYASEDAVNPPTVMQQPADVSLTLPPRFSIEAFATGFERPRWMALAPNGDVFVSDAKAGSVVILRDADRDGVAETRFTFAENLMQPFGLAFHDASLYVGCTNAVLRFPYRAGQTAAESEGTKIADLPGRGYREHWTRNVVFSPDGKTMFVSIGSESNVAPEDDPMRAAIAAFNPDGSGKRIFASGLRNPIGLAFHPATGKLWAAVQERDRLGDDLVPDYITEVREGGFYGWPYAYLGPHEDPRRKGERPDLVEKT